MSLINKTNNFKSKSIGSLKDYQAFYKYKGERAKQRHKYSYDNKQRFIDEVNQDSQLYNAHLKAKINVTKNRHKIRIVNQFTNLHTTIIIIFSMLSACLSCYGVTKTVSNIWFKACILGLTMILLLGNNIAIQPKLISSLRFNKSLENIVGTSLLAISSLSIFVVSIITNKITLDKLNIQDKFLPWAFTFGFDVAVLGLNFLQYSSAMFDVKDDVKQDLDIQDTNLDIHSSNKDIHSNRRSKVSDINKIIDNAKPGELLEYKQGSNFSSGAWNRTINKRDDVEKINGKYYKKGVANE